PLAHDQPGERLTAGPGEGAEREGARELPVRRVHAAGPGSTADQPPSTTMLAPVTYAALSLARNRATLTTSAGVPSRPNGTLAAIRCMGWAGSAISSCPPSVSIIPGLIALTRIPCAAPSAASCLVAPITPALDAECATRLFVTEPRSPAVDATLITLPPRRCRCGQACLVVRE